MRKCREGERWRRKAATTREQSENNTRKR